MTTWYVATLACYVLVEVANEDEACTKGRAALRELYADLRERPKREVPIKIRTIRHATEEEVRLMNWHNAMVAREAARTGA